MHKFILISALVACLLVVAQADTQSFTSSGDNLPAEYNQLLTLSKFNPALGTLTNTEYTLFFTVTQSGTVTNNEAGPQTYSVENFLYPVVLKGNKIALGVLAGISAYDTLVTDFASDLVIETRGSNPTEEVIGVGSITGVNAGSTAGLKGSMAALSLNAEESKPFIPEDAVARRTKTYSGTLTAGDVTGSGDFELTLKSASSLTLSPAGNVVAAITTIGSYLFTVTYTYTPSGGATGDPQIVGFQGQKYQIHGIPDEHFNLVSTPTYYVNSHFVYMANGVCNYNDTECFSHAGTYIDQLAVVTANGKGKLKLVAGSHAAGMVVYLNDQLLSVGARISLGTNDSYVHVISTSRATIVLPDVAFTVANSDNFFNLAAELTRTDLLRAGAQYVRISTLDAAAADKVISQAYPEALLHGLLGQTWRNIEWPHQRLYQGEPLDYQTPSLYDPDFVYSQYVH